MFLLLLLHLLIPAISQILELLILGLLELFSLLLLFNEEVIHLLATLEALVFIDLCLDLFCFQAVAFSNRFCSGFFKFSSISSEDMF